MTAVCPWGNNRSVLQTNTQFQITTKTNQKCSTDSTVFLQDTAHRFTPKTPYSAHTVMWRRSRF